MTSYNKIFRSRETLKDPGFGNKDASKGGRFINKDGSFNIRQQGLPFFRSFSFYHYLITISWFKFCVYILISYLLINVFFASLYLFTGIEKLDGTGGETAFQNFQDAFFFSTQTFTTVGYGRINPIGFSSNIIASLESLTGLLSAALATGLLYGRFSRPNANIIFSDQAVIAPYQDMTGFMFKIANARNNQLINVEVQVAFTRVEKVQGLDVRKYFELNLERTKIDFFSLSWTVVHPIDENSPLWGISKEELDNSDAEFLILLKAFDDTFSQNVHTRSSYKFNEIAWNYKFVDAFKREDGITILELDKISTIEKA
ncbi:MAG TPA: ion channel [Cytophagaceae bacterium]|jgi:inward rectifier potassium channel|nr:ion channel [Cytophagaceae bacterium]